MWAQCYLGIDHCNMHKRSQALVFVLLVKMCTQRHLWPTCVIMHLHLVMCCQKNVHSKAFVTYVCDHALPVLDKLASPDADTNVQLDLLKLFADISEHAGDLDNQEARVEKVYTRLLVRLDSSSCCVHGKCMCVHWSYQHFVLVSWDVLSSTSSAFILLLDTSRLRQYIIHADNIWALIVMCIELENSHGIFSEFSMYSA